MSATEIMTAPLGQQMIEKWGWTPETFAKLGSYVSELRAAIQADRRPNGPRAKRVKEEFRRSFGATQTDLNHLEYSDRRWQQEGLGLAKGIAQQAQDAEYVASLMGLSTTGSPA